MVMVKNILFEYPGAYEMDRMNGELLTEIILWLVLKVGSPHTYTALLCFRFIE